MVSGILLCRTRLSQRLWAGSSTSLVMVQNDQTQAYNSINRMAQQSFESFPLFLAIHDQSSWRQWWCILHLSTFRFYRDKIKEDKICIKGDWFLAQMMQTRIWQKKKLTNNFGDSVNVVRAILGSTYYRWGHQQACKKQNWKRATLDGCGRTGRVQLQTGVEDGIVQWWAPLGEKVAERPRIALWSAASYFCTQAIRRWGEQTEVAVNLFRGYKFHIGTGHCPFLVPPKTPKMTHFGRFGGYWKWHFRCSNQNSKTTFQHKYPP